MNESRRNMWVGLFVFFGLTAFGALAVMFGKVPTWIVPGGSYRLEIRFESVSGIREGTMVTMAGKEIGRVQGVEFVDAAHIDRGIKVVAAIEMKYRLPKGARAETNEAILGMGRPPIQILVDAPSTEYLPIGTSLLGRSASAVETVFPSRVVDTMQKTATQIGEAAAALTPVLNDLHELLDQRETADVDRGAKAGNLASAATRLDELIKHFNDVLGDPAVKSQFKDGIANFHAITEDGKQVAAKFREIAEDAKGVTADATALVGRVNESITRVDQHADRVARGVTESLDKTAGILSDLSVASAQIRKGEGTIGRMVSDDRLYESMVLTFRRLAETVEEFKALVKDWQKGKIRVAL